MSTRWWGAAPAALALAGTLLLGGGAAAQESTVTNDDLGLVAEIHQGTCAQFSTDVTFPLGSLSRSGTGVGETSGDTSATGFGNLGTGTVGTADTTPVWTTRRTVDAAPADLFGSSQSYALVVGESGPNGAVAACGDLGGVVANDRVAVALLPVNATQNNGSLIGVAVFDEPGATGTLGAITTDATETAQAAAGNQTRVTVYVFSLGVGGPAGTPTAISAEATPTVEPASPTAEATTEPTVETTVTAEPTVEATGSPSA